MRAFRRVPTRIAPPDLTKARNLIGEYLIRAHPVQAVEEVIDVHVVRHFANDTVVHHEAAITDPEVNAVILNDAVHRDDRRGGADRVESEHIRAARVIDADQAIERPQQAGRVLTTATQRQALDDLRGSNERIACVTRREVRGIVRIRPLNVPVLGKHKQVRVQHHHATAHASRRDGCQGRRVIDVAEIGRIVRASRNIESRLRRVRDDHCRAASAVIERVELPHDVRATRERRGRARHHRAGVTCAINRHALNAITVTHVGIGEVIQRLQVELIDDAFDVIGDLPITADLTRKTALKADPLPVNVEVPLELRAVTLDARL